MTLQINDARLLTKAEFDALPEYSHSFPTGQTPGKAWKAQRQNGEWWRGSYGLPYPPGHEHHGQIPIGWRRIIVAGAPVRWPRDVKVDPPVMRGRIRAA